MGEDSIDYNDLRKRAVSQPLVSDKFTADPSAHVFEGKILLIDLTNKFESFLSDLLTTKMSANSKIPAFKSLISSPDSGTNTKVVKSVISDTLYSD